jgi:hypothetical protein
VSNVNNITNGFESLFKRCKSLNNSEYEEVIMNIELLKKLYFNPSFIKKNRDLFDGEMTFKELIFKNENLHTI